MSFYGWIGLLFFVSSFLFSCLLDLGWVILSIIGGIFAIALYLLVTDLNSNTDLSFINLVRQKKYKHIIIIFLYSMFLGLLIELIGQFLLKLWYYPPIKIIPFLFILIPFFYVVFGIIVRETYLYLGKFFKSYLLKTVLTALILMLLIEAIDIFTLSWIYAPMNPIVLAVGWILLVLTFYVIPQKLKLFP